MSTPPTPVKLWSEARDYEKNMCSSWTHAGLGVVVDNDGMVFCTQLFATVTQAQMATRQRFSGF